MATPAKAPSKETWADWIGAFVPLDPDNLMTRAEFVEALNREGIGVSASALAYWENAGILPKGIRGRRGSAPQSLYPPAALAFVYALRSMQRSGIPLDRIRVALREIPEQMADLSPETWESLEALKKVMTVSGVPEAIPAFNRHLDTLIADAVPLMLAYERVTGLPIAYAEVTLVLATGKAASFRLRRPERIASNGDDTDAA